MGLNKLPANTQKILIKPKDKWYEGPKDKLLIKIDELKDKLIQAPVMKQAIRRISREVVNTINETWSAKLNWFNTPDKLQIQFLGICYLIDSYIPSANTNPQQYTILTVEPASFIEWIKKLFPNNNIQFNPDTMYISQLESLKLYSNVIYLEDSYNDPVLDLEKITSKNEQLFSKIGRNEIPHNFKHIFQLRYANIEDDAYLYANMDGVCRSLSKYKMIYTHAAKNSHQSKEIKKQYHTSLKVTNPNDNLKTLKESNKEAPIPLLSLMPFYESDYIDKLFHHIQDICARSTSNKNEGVSFGHAMLLMVALMKQNKLNQIYALPQDLRHIIFISATTKGNLVKFKLSDPNSSQSHVSFYIRLAKFNSNDFSSLDNFNNQFGHVIDELNQLLYHIDIHNKKPLVPYIHRHINEILYWNLKIFASSLTSSKFGLQKLQNSFLQEHLAQLNKDTKQKVCIFNTVKTLPHKLLRDKIIIIYQVYNEEDSTHEGSNAKVRATQPQFFLTCGSEEQQIHLNNGTPLNIVRNFTPNTILSPEMVEKLFSINLSTLDLNPSPKSKNALSMKIAIIIKNHELIKQIIKLKNYKYESLRDDVNTSLYSQHRLEKQILRNQ